jgi:hypothetical protein
MEETPKKVAVKKKRRKKYKRAYSSQIKPLMDIPAKAWDFCKIKHYPIFDHNLLVKDVLFKMQLRGISFRMAAKDMEICQNTLHKFIRGSALNYNVSMKVISWLGDSVLRYHHTSPNKEEFPIKLVTKETIEKFKLHPNFKNESIKIKVDKRMKDIIKE